MQQKIFIGLVLTLIIVIFIPIYWAMEPGRQEAARERQQAEAVERGAELYTLQCAGCHGSGGGGGIGPPLKDSQLDEETLEKIIARGVAGTAMPAFGEEDGGLLKRHQIKYLVTFIRNLNQSLIESPSAPTPALAPSPTETPVPTQAPVESLEDIKYDPNTPDNILLSGKRTFQSSCSACHDLSSAQVIKDFASDEALLEVAIPMTKLAELSIDHAEKVIRYLIAVRYGTAP